jgi:hypothetical protein
MEVDHFWRIVSSPPVHADITAARQDLIAELIDKASASADLVQGLRKGYEIAEGLNKLFEVLFEKSENKGDKLAAERQRIVYPINEDDEPIVQSSNNLIKELEWSRQAVLGLRNRSATFNNDSIKKMLSDIHEACVALGSLTLDRLIADTNGEEDKKDHIIDAAKALSDLLYKFCAIGSFAQLAIKDDYCRVTFDTTQDDSYQEAWNLLREKEGGDETWRDERVDPQVRCASPSSMAHVVICGSNMAGKTFFLQRDLMLRLAAQSFGFAPAKNANIHHGDSFIWLERTSPCASKVMIAGQEKGASDFCREVLVHKDAYTKVGQRCYWYSDESWTTTSPEYEYLLSIAEDRYLAGRNVRRYSISHNNAVLEFWQNQANTSVHHFAVSNPDGERPAFTRNLAAGIDPSRAFDVARSLGLHSEFLYLGGDYLAGRFKVRPAPTVERPLTTYSNDEREDLKLVP